MSPMRRKVIQSCPPTDIAPTAVTPFLSRICCAFKNAASRSLGCGGGTTLSNKACAASTKTPAGAPDAVFSIRPPAGAFDPRSLMPGAREAWLEIGFGGGEHMAAQAAAHPDVLVLGAEPFQNGVASALRHVDEQGLGNVRIHDGDARELMARLPDASVVRVFILFPDPWPKGRHKKRRLVQAETVAELAMVSPMLIDMMKKVTKPP